MRSAIRMELPANQRQVELPGAGSINIYHARVQWPAHISFVVPNTQPDLQPAVERPSLA